MNPFFRASNQSFYLLSRRFKDLGSRAVANNAEADVLFTDAANAQLLLDADGRDILERRFEEDPLQVESVHKNQASSWVSEPCNALFTIPVVCMEYAIIALNEWRYRMVADCGAFRDGCVLSEAANSGKVPSKPETSGESGLQGRGILQQILALVALFMSTNEGDATHSHVSPP